MQTNQCITDDAMAAWVQGHAAPEVAANLRAHISGCAVCRTVAAELSRTSGARPLPKSLGRYILKEKVGAGGMGTVWAAWDPVVERQVAVKVLHEAHLDGAQGTQRFLQERQVLAGLEHPHISRLLDAGETAEGRPWFAMDFVDGQPLDVYCDEKRLTVRQRLTLMLPVFSAVAYAHQHLVVHRDLKPGNILVDEAGAPRLVDFGIARLLEGSAGLTATGLAPMTPAYASPEQVRREPAALASDVYSLGVVLYEVLAGCGPYDVPDAGFDHLLRAIQSVDPLPPSQSLARTSDDAVARRAPTREKLRSALAADVDAIVLMALRKEPRDRYQTVQALADDVRCALEGLPTLARKGSAAYRASRFVRRRKALVAGVVAAFLALSVGLVATLWQARRAEAQRDAARLRFEQVRQLARTVLFDYHDGIADLPGSTPLRQRLVEDAKGYLEGLAEDARADVGLQRELATAYLKLGDVQGDPYAASLGDTTAAKASYLKGRAYAEGLLKVQPSDWEARRVVASSHEKLGAISEVAGDLKDALAGYETAHTLDAALSAERPDDLEQRLTVSRDDVAAGQVLMALGRMPESEVYLQRALAERRKVLESRRDVKTRRGVGVVLISLSEVNQELGHLEKAIALGEEAEGIFVALTKENPDAVDLQRAVSRSWANLAGLYRLAKLPAKSVEVAKKSLGQARGGLAADPTNAVAKRDVVVGLANLGMALSANDELEAMPGRGAEALALQRALQQADPANNQTYRDLLSILAMAGNGALYRKEYELAESRFRESIQVAVKARPLMTESAVVDEEAVMAHHGLAAVRALQSRFEEALAENALVVSGTEGLLADNPSLKRLENRLAMSLALQGEYRAKWAETLDGDEAKAAWKQAKVDLTRAVSLFEALEKEGTNTGTALKPHEDTAALLVTVNKALKKK